MAKKQLTENQATELLAEGLRKYRCHFSPEEAVNGSWRKFGSAPAILYAIRKAYELGLAERK